MAQIEVSLLLPYLLHISNGAYDTPAVAGTLHVTRIEEPDVTDGPGRSRTRVAQHFDAALDLPANEIERTSADAVDKILPGTNHLLRWYRCVTEQAAIVEVSRAQASPFLFVHVATDAPWREPLVSAADPPRTAAQQTRQRVTARVRRGLKKNEDPPVAELFLLDARQAVRNGRFREAVLFCWSTIDATFNEKYERILETKLADEWASGREWFKDHRFGMKNKMTAALFLMCGTSLHRALGDSLWQDLSVSYNKRNDIIHRGDTASEVDADQALNVAGQVVEVMNEL